MPTAIVLSGGGAKGDFEVGVLRCLYDRGIRADIICGVSVGAINAAKLAEGEDPNNPTQGLAGLEALWAGLQRNSDMFVDADWLSDPGLDPAVRDYITGRTGRLGITAPAPPGPALGDILGPAVEAVSGLVFLLKDGQALLRSLGVIQRRARNLFELSPVTAKLRTNLNPTLVAAWASGGRHLRLGTVALESGRLRYVTETGAMIETDGSAVMDTGSVAAPCQQLAAELEGERQALADLQSELQQSAPPEKPSIAKQIRAQRGVVAAKAAELAACMNSARRQPLMVPLAEGTLASASIPGVFRPVSLGGETYVDGGIREVLPLQAAVDLGADKIYAVSASSPDLLPGSSGFGSAGIFEIIGRSLTEITIHEIAMTDFSVRPRAGQPLPHIADIHPDLDIHGITTIDPGLIQINRDYGYMRAADVLDDVASQSRRYQLATEIALHRVGAWALENLHAGQPDPLHATPSPGQPRPELRVEIDAAKQALARLLDERRSLGGAMPAGIDAFSGRPELHPWLTLLNDAVVVNISSPPNGSAPGMSVAASVTMRNTGTTTWDPALGYSLGSQQPRDNTIWGTARVPLRAPVPPGGQATFTFIVTVPAPPEAVFAWQMVQDGVEWFGAATSPAAVTIAEHPRCVPIRRTIETNLAEVRLLQDTKAALNPRDPADRNEIRTINRQITDLEAQNATLRVEANGLGCVSLP